MSTSTENATAAPRVLGLRDLVLFNVAAVVSPRWIATAAHAGAGSITLWILAAVFFFVPSAITVAHLSRRYPTQGGFYVWVRESFGDWHAYLAVWFYFINNLFWIPNLVLATIGMIGAAFPAFAAVGENARWLVPAALFFICLITYLNYIGLRVVKWVDNAGGLAVYGIWAILVIAAIAVFVHRGPATHLKLLPAFELDKLNFWSQLAFAMGGLELCPILAGEIRNPRHNIQRATWLSAACIVLIYAGGTGALLTLLPPDLVSPVVGLTQGGTIAAADAGLTFAPYAIAALVFFSLCGQLGTYVGGCARLPQVLGVSNLLPPVFARLHPRYGTPYLSILLIGAGSAVLLIASQFGESFRAAYQKLVDLTVITQLIPFVYIFGAAWKSGLRLCAVSGATVSIVAIAFSFVPTSDVRSVPLFEGELIGCTIAMVLIARWLYLRYRAVAPSAGAISPSAR
jgi:amino acid transporter